MGRGGGALAPGGLVSVPVLEVCTGWGPVIHSANCSDSESISLSATMVRIQEGSGDAEKASRERKREKRKREKLASKAGAVHAGNAEITPPELLGMHSAGRASGKDSYDRGICAVLRSCPAVHPASGGSSTSAPGGSFAFSWFKPSFDGEHSE